MTQPPLIGNHFTKSARFHAVWTHLCHSTINFAVMHNAHSYSDVVGYDPRAEGAYEAARVHHAVLLGLTGSILGWPDQ